MVSALVTNTQFCFPGHGQLNALLLASPRSTEPGLACLLHTSHPIPSQRAARRPQLAQSSQIISALSKDCNNMRVLHTTASDAAVRDACSSFTAFRARHCTTSFHIYTTIHGCITATGYTEIPVTFGTACPSCSVGEGLVLVPFHGFYRGLR